MKTLSTGEPQESTNAEEFNVQQYYIKRVKQIQW